jgi:hypothetical protein
MIFQDSKVIQEQLSVTANGSGVCDHHADNKALAIIYSKIC